MAKIKDINKAIGRMIKEARNKRHLSKKDLEDLSGISYSYIDKIERGTNSPSLETITRLLGPMGAHIEVVIEPEPAMTKKHLMSLVKGGAPTNVFEQLFLNEYYRWKSPTKRREALLRWTRYETTHEKEKRRRSEEEGDLIYE